MNRKALVIFCLISTTALGATPGKVVGQMGLVEGEVFVDSKPVQKNASVREGSVVETKKGHATLLIGKGSVFNLAPDSKMVVTEYTAKTDTAPEGADLDLKFGRTRALILNQGGEKKDIKIKARAATMGVRGTEIFVDAPKDPGKPIQFFTLEGKAEVTAHPGAPVVPVAQNEGVATSGAPAPANSSGIGGNANGGKGGTAANNNSGGNVNGGTATTAGATGSGTIASTMSMGDVNTAIKSSGIGTTAPTQIPQAPVTPAASAPGSLSATLGIGSLPPIQFDPIQDRANSPLTIRPRFCNATTGQCVN